MATAHARPKDYVPAFGYDFLLPLYDPLQRWVLREETFKKRLIREAAIGDDHRVLDLGCGTATLSMFIKQLHPRASVVGLDGDAKALARAEHKARAAGLDLHFDEGLSYALPYADGSFDRVLSSLMLHHLTHEQKLRTLGEVLRVLVPGGSLHVVDIGPPASRLGRLLAHVAHHGERRRDSVEGLLADLCREAGFVDVKEGGQHRTLLATLVFHRARKAGAA
jgi:SAM-dependent methyltransferase